MTETQWLVAFLTANAMLWLSINRFLKTKRKAMGVDVAHPPNVVAGHEPDCHECHVAMAQEFELAKRLMPRPKK